MRRAVSRAALLVLGLAAFALGGCGSKAATSPAVLRLEREDLVHVARALNYAAPAVRVEVAATKAAWPLVANGLPATTRTLSGSPIAAADNRAAALNTPALFQERAAASIAGPGAQLAGELRNFIVLSARGWQMIDAAIDQIQHGSAASARFARANVDLYIESVYDAHFTLAQIGKQLLAAYRKLGGPAAFAAALTPHEVQALAQAYSEASDRLHPHEGVVLGS
jgi:hypothetical protein